MKRWIWLLLCCPQGWAQSPSRGIVPEEVLQARPAAATAAPMTRPNYHPVPTAGRPVAGGRQVGVTIWRLRPATGKDVAPARILVQEESQTQEWIPERVSSTSRLKPGDKVRLSIESPEPGYLYVIDREQYANGERGEPYLIFPTTRTHEGNNALTAGRLIDIPGQDDRPNFFSLRRSRIDQTGEELTVLLTDKPLPEIEIGPKALRLSEAQVAEWEKKWEMAKPSVFELAGGTGQPWTRAEQMAAAGRTRVLTQEDPAPQTVYRVAVKPGEPILVKLRLRL
jgi:hypothetical protein